MSTGAICIMGPCAVKCTHKSIQHQTKRGPAGAKSDIWLVNAYQRLDQHHKQTGRASAAAIESALRCILSTHWCRQNNNSLTWQTVGVQKPSDITQPAEALHRTIPLALSQRNCVEARHIYTQRFSKQYRPPITLSHNSQGKMSLNQL